MGELYKRRCCSATTRGRPVKLLCARRSWNAERQSADHGAGLRGRFGCQCIVHCRPHARADHNRNPVPMTGATVHTVVTLTGTGFLGATKIHFYDPHGTDTIQTPDRAQRYDTDLYESAEQQARKCRCGWWVRTAGAIVAADPRFLSANVAGFFRERVQQCSATEFVPTPNDRPPAWHRGQDYPGEVLCGCSESECCQSQTPAEGLSPSPASRHLGLAGRAARLWKIGSVAGDDRLITLGAAQGERAIALFPEVAAHADASSAVVVSAGDQRASWLP